MSEKKYKPSSVLVEFGTRRPVMIEDFRSPEEYWQDEWHESNKEREQLLDENATLREEVERLKDLLNQHETYTNENWYKDLQSKLSRYEGGIETEGIVMTMHGCPVIKIDNDSLDHMYCQDRVRVLVMPCEEGKDE